MSERKVGMSPVLGMGFKGSKPLTRRADPYEAMARSLCTQAGGDPDSRVYSGTLDARGRPAWTDFRDAARAQRNAEEQAAAAIEFPPQDPKYADAPLTIIGDAEENTVTQMRNCMKVGNVVGGALMADNHLGYAQPVGGVVAYEDQISLSGVGFDIACGNMAVKLALPASRVRDDISRIMRQIGSTISFGVGRTNNERVEHSLFDDAEAWRVSDREDFKDKARAQLGTVGSGNHYVDLFEDENGLTWIGVHFGSRGLGHTTATKYIKAAGGKDTIHGPPTVVDVRSELGERYLAAMHLAGRYAYAGREWVVNRVNEILGSPPIIDTVHNHHNFAWQEPVGDINAWVVRKGATPAWAGQRGFVGGSMGDDAVILHGMKYTDADGFTSAARYGGYLHSTVHGAGRICGRNDAKRRFTREEMAEWLTRKGVTLIGGDLDESPMAYRRLSDVLKAQGDTIEIEHTLRPFGVAMAGSEFDPYKD
jgi:tRNA-splicing ligase RtcB (3'-phosphate/5'-hydroxy nucleic acid ligase)